MLFSKNAVSVLNDPVAVTLPLTATVLVPLEEPTVIVVVDPLALLVPMLIVLVLPDAVTPTAKL